jgi:hypothetical protein
MAIVVDIISEFSDRGLKSAKGAFNDFKTRVGAAEGAMGKFKAGSTAALDIVKANAGAFALGAGAAMAGFAAKSVMAFQDLALAAGKFSDATGLAVDESSRWIEVAGDIGIEAGTVEQSIGFMNKTLGKSPDLFKQLGVEVARTSGGAVDANKTFLNVIDRLNSIKDPAERARVASQLLGKGWQSMAELIGQGSTSLTKSLNEVSSAKVITTQELANARKFRESLDNLKDSGEDLAISLGTGLVPVLADIVGFVNKGVQFFKDAANGITYYANELTDLAGLTSSAWLDAAKAQIDVNIKDAETRRDGNQALIDAYKATHNLTWAEEEHTQAVWALTDAWQMMLGTLDIKAAFRGAADSIREMNAAAIEAFADPTKFNAYKDQQDQVIRKFAQILELIGATDEEQNRIKFLIDTAPLEYALEALNRLQLVNTGQISNNLTLTGRRASGGAVSAGGTYLVGERGPELLSIGSGGRVTPNGGIGGNSITVNVNGGDPNAIVRALQQYVRQSGPVPVNTRAM